MHSIKLTEVNGKRPSTAVCVRVLSEGYNLDGTEEKDSQIGKFQISEYSSGWNH